MLCQLFSRFHLFTAGKKTKSQMNTDKHRNYFYVGNPLRSSAVPFFLCVLCDLCGEGFVRVSW
jgi:hypothetical protein